MSLVSEILSELRKMFLADGRMSLAVLAMVAIAALAGGIGAPDGLVELVLLLGAPAVLTFAVLSALPPRN
uniref:hypothetical protein n=1 Tax=Roseovarius indicus TaxID=540747 RepID=UPI003B51CBA5